jgi:6-phosphofructokinase
LLINISRGITMSLNYNYHVSDVFGIQYSFKGLFEYELIDLNTNFVKSIHHLGGSILGMQKTDFDVKYIIF